MITAIIDTVKDISVQLKERGWGCVEYGYQDSEGRIVTHNQGEQSYIGLTDTLGRSAYIRDLDGEVQLNTLGGACNKAKQAVVNLRLVGMSTERDTAQRLADKLMADLQTTKFSRSAWLDIKRINTNYAAIYGEETDKEPRDGLLSLAAVDFVLYLDMKFCNKTLTFC
jgi:predicted RNA-binding protein YlxR (DUF448 family)